MRLAATVALMTFVVSCAHRHPPPERDEAVAPTVAAPVEPPPPVCADQPVQNAGLTTGDVVSCSGGYLVSSQDLKQAAITQAARYALLARRSHFLLIAETKELTEGRKSAVQCVERETRASRRSRVLHAVGEGLASTGDSDTSRTTARCRSDAFGGVDCDATTTGPRRHTPTPAPPVLTETSCSGGEPIPGTEGHVVHLSVSFLTAEEAAGMPGAINAFMALGLPSAPAPASVPSSEPQATPASKDVLPPTSAPSHANPDSRPPTLF